MKRSTVLLIAFAFITPIFLTSCEEPENQIIGLWRLLSIEETYSEDGEVRGIEARYYSDDELIYWEFMDQSLYIYEGEDKELEQTFSWIIRGGEELLITSDSPSEDELEILTLTRKEMILMAEYIQTFNNTIAVREMRYIFERVED